MKGHPCYDKQEKCSIIACRCSPYCIGKYIPSAVLGSFLSTPFSMLGKGSNNQNGNLRWHLPGGGGGLEGVLSATYLF